MKGEITSAIDRVLSWPVERQEDAAELIRLIEEHDQSPYQLDDQQQAEVRRRLSVTGSKSLTLDQIDKRLRVLGI